MVPVCGLSPQKFDIAVLKAIHFFQRPQLMQHGFFFVGQGAAHLLRRLEQALKVGQEEQGHPLFHAQHFVDRIVLDGAEGLAFFRGNVGVIPQIDFI